MGKWIAATILGALVAAIAFNRSRSDAPPRDASATAGGEPPSHGLDDGEGGGYSPAITYGGDGSSSSGLDDGEHREIEGTVGTPDEITIAGRTYDYATMRPRP